MGYSKPADAAEGSRFRWSGPFSRGRRSGQAALLTLPLFFGSAGSCTPDSGATPGGFVQRDTLENGVVRVRYSSLPPDRLGTAVADMEFGDVDGEEPFVFGDVRGVDADRDGNIYVLDYLASEIRAFDRSGQFLRNVASKGQGPGEIGEANGMILVGDSILWAQDHGKWMMIGLSPEGGEVARVPMHVRSYGFVWSGTVDNAGRMWKQQSHSDSEQPRPLPDGLNEGSSRSYWKSFDPLTNATDSVFLGEAGWRTFVTQIGSGWSYMRIPFDSQPVTAVDPDGGFWHVQNDAYRVARLNEAGDTTLVLEVNVDPIPVEPGDRAAFIDQVAERGSEYRRTAEAVAELMPENKPVIEKLIPDDEGRLWVERSVREGAEPVYDIFDREGEYLGSVRLGFRPDQYRPIRIRHGFIYAVVLDEWDVPSVVRAPVPEEVGGGSRGS